MTAVYLLVLTRRGNRYLDRGNGTGVTVSGGVTGPRTKVPAVTARLSSPHTD
jgi:hypothetical protein